MNWDIFSFQELCTDPCDMGLCNIILKHEVMAADEWLDNGPQDLVMVSLYIQIALNKMWSSLSVAYACPFQSHYGAVFTMLTSANRSPTRHHTHCLPSAWDS
jgi:hypothetical protein